ncbi:class I SAM-dependent methyltransferase [Herbaspirillum sp. alder98]|uniref:class I SAM-dependent methyltransferase n=1 Tax=Herbaspirillum sp. alder98 TaxID=2913096 RepID=UPI001CD904FD|nr:class I SAM-dependent methyltransferase [Herbaspirillum sp. alder98]MCA1326251.1 class I SAM-dependent methyltransferase [Herbaspirillum sp. alder98]
MYTELKSCRICGNTDLQQVLDLGEQTLTGIFPKQRDQEITRGPLRLLKCTGSDECCGLLQLAHSYDLGEMYGENYGYRSGLNASMVRHLNAKVERILKLVDVSDDSVILDIGSNDGTTLRAYGEQAGQRIGIDPTAEKFRQYYPSGVTIVPDFFSASLFNKAFPGKKARVVTSFSMFYDLERPFDFVSEVAAILDQEGIWVFEQSYMPLMLERNSYDTACHEHLEYYAIKQIQWMTQRAGLKIVDVEFNDINGGSFSVTVAHRDASYPEFAGLAALCQQELDAGLDTLAPYQAFADRVSENRRVLREFVTNALAQGKRVACLGASTKGNVLLQYCGFTPEEIIAVGEVNPDKYGSFTPGTLLPIVPETDFLDNEPDYLIVLPWHFREFFIKNNKLKKGKLVFPLPNLEIIG